MSDAVQLSAGVPTQSISEVLGPGIVGLFIQGLEIGLVLSQISQWLYLGRRDGIVITLLVLFVTTVGFVQTAIVFLSAWRSYVRNFGQTVHIEWTDSIHAMLSSLIASPIQAYFIWRCYFILKKNIYLIVPLVVTLISSIVTAGWVTAWIFGNLAAGKKHPAEFHPNTKITYPFVLFLTLPAVLDIAITSILLYSLSTFLRDIHTEHIRTRVTRYMVVIWQAAIPPLVCALAFLIKYVAFTLTHPGKSQMWYPTIQAMLGKLYVLSLYFTLNNRIDLSIEAPVTYVTTINPSFEGVGSPAQRYVFSVHYPAQEQQC